MKRLFKTAPALVLLAAMGTAAIAQDYPAPIPMKEGAQAPIEAIVKKDHKLRIAFMPPATEFNYYIAINEGIKAVATEKGVDVFMLADSVAQIG